MDHPRWTEAVEIVYEQPGGTFRTDELSNSDALDGYALPKDEAEEAFRVAYQSGLLDQRPSGEEKLYTLTEEGFSVAHDRKQSEVDQSHRHLMTVFTMVLGLAAAVELAMSVIRMEPGVEKWGATGLVLIFLLVFLFLLRRPVGSLTRDWRE